MLVGGGALLITRASVATMVTIHGDGMAPTVMDDDAVLVVRGRLSIERGDVVVYDPESVSGSADPEDPEEAPPIGDDARSRSHAPDDAPSSPLRNTNVVDADALDAGWERVRAKARSTRRGSYRLGRVLAVPGDTVTFFVPDAPLGLAIEGVPIATKPAAPQRIGRGEDAAMRSAAYEWSGSTRYTVLPGSTAAATAAPGWPALDLPRDHGPVQLRANGYLIVADNRDESACCDSRALGWIPAAAVRGEVVMRLASGADPERRVTWLP